MLAVPDFTRISTLFLPSLLAASMPRRHRTAGDRLARGLEDDVALLQALLGRGACPDRCRTTTTPSWPRCGRAASSRAWRATVSLSPLRSRFVSTLASCRPAWSPSVTSTVFGAPLRIIASFAVFLGPSAAMRRASSRGPATGSPSTEVITSPLLIAGRRGGRILLRLGDQRARRCPSGRDCRRCPASPAGSGRRSSRASPCLRLELRRRRS